MTYAQARASLREPYTPALLDRWVIYHSTSGGPKFEQAAADLLAPLDADALAGRLDYWLDETQAHPSGRTKAETLGQDVGEWPEVLAKSKELVDGQLKKKLANNNPMSPQKLLEAKAGERQNAAITDANRQLFTDEICASARPHYVVPEKDLDLFLTGRAKRTYPATLRATARTILDHHVEERLRTEVRKVVDAYFDLHLKPLLPMLHVDGRLKNADRAVIDERKLTAYALNPDHPVGGNKAKVFNAVLGITKEHWKHVDAALRDAVRREPAILETGRAKPEGASFTIRFMISGVEAKAANRGLVESGWMVKKNEDFPTLITCFLVGGGRGWAPNVVYKAIFADDTLVPEDEHPERLPEPTWQYVQSQKERPRVERRHTKTGRLYQERHYDAEGHPVKDVDHTSPVLPDGRPFADHPKPGHEHRWVPRSKERPEDGWNREGGDG